MSGTWKTKYGPRRVRNDQPTLEEAILAARGLSDDVQEQIEIAAALIDKPREEVMAASARLAQRKDVNRTLAFTGRGSVQRAVVVERKPPRRGLTPVVARASGAPERGWRGRPPAGARRTVR